MNFNCLIPELRVFDLEKSKKFYTEILGFSIAYQREDFAMVVLEDCQIMLQKLTLPSPQGSWNVSEDMKYPLGRGINFQIILPDISKVYNSLKKEKVKIFIDLLLSDYQENDIINNVLEFLVQDPDGYLLRFQQDITCWRLGNNQKLSDELFNLVLSGEKTATSYLYDENEKIESGFSVLTNWNKTKKTAVLPFFFVFCFVGKNLYYPQYFVEQYYRNNVYNPENHRAEDQHQYCKQSCDKTLFCDAANKSVNCPDNVKYGQSQNYFDDFGQRVKAFNYCVHNSPPILLLPLYTVVITISRGY